MSEVPHMPTEMEILAKAIELFQKANPGAPTPKEDKLKIEGYWEDARKELLIGARFQLEGYLANLESEAVSIHDELGVKADLPPKEVSELEEHLSSVIARLSGTKKRLKEVREAIDELRGVKVPEKVIVRKSVCPTHKEELIAVIGPHQFRWGRIDVPSQMFLFQCPIEFEYHICEPGKACVLVSLDKLKLRLARIIKPIAPARPAPAPGLRNATRFDEPSELEPNFTDFLAEVGIKMEDYKRLDRLGQFTMRSEYRRWKMRPY